ncbi:MAG: hypothetical protein PHV74_13990 [Dehalococcoidia bacterium]|nr:hypothetical protein [Dehalococcoidia bacterium]
MDIWSLVTGGPLAAWIAYIHFSRPSRKECDLRHDSVERDQDNTCTKMEAMHHDIREIREILIHHVSKG